MTASPLRYAGFWRRAAAALIDTLLLVIAGLVLSLIPGLFLPVMADAAPAHAGGLLWGLAVWLLPPVLTVAFWVRLQGTPGKLLMGCRVVCARTGGSLPLGRAVLRYLGYLLSTLPLYLGFLWVLWDARKQGWHDKIAASVVVLEDDCGEVV